MVKRNQKRDGEVSFDDIENRHSGIEINCQILMHIPHKKASLLICALCDPTRLTHICMYRDLILDTKASATYSVFKINGPPWHF